MLTRGAPQLPRPIALVILLELNWILLAAGPMACATNYFLSPRGDDNGHGTNAAAAWRTVDRANQTRFGPGDRLLLEGGAVFPGTLVLAAEDAGTPDAPVTIGSFGHGRATLSAGRETGITVENAGGIVIENLLVLGAGRTNNLGHGIRCDNTLTNSQRLSHLTISNVDVQGFGIFGILVAGDRAGFERVRITDCALHDNLRGGMEVAGRLPWDATSYAHTDVRVDRCLAYDNTGDPDFLKNHSGSGIVLYQVDGGVMERCQAWNNGALCRSAGGGGVGLWTCASRRVVIQHCESFANRTSSADGGGFDIDGGCEDCVLQYNFSHHNDGPGLMVYSYPYASHRDHGNIVRFNVSYHDSRKGNRYAGLWVRTDGPSMSGLEIYNITVVIGPWTDQAARFHGLNVEARVRNNSFVASGSAWPLRVEAPTDKLRFESNLYWREGGPTRIGWGDVVFTSLADWRMATGQESLVGEALGVFADPDLPLQRVPVGADVMRGETGLRWFSPRIGSPALAAGLDLRHRFGLDIGHKELLGAPLEGRLPLGAIATPYTD